MSKQRVVVVGLGRWGKNLVRNFSELGVLYGVADRSPQQKDQFASLYSVPALTVEEALADKVVTAIAIATPVAQIRNILKTISPSLSPKTIVIDVFKIATPTVE